MKAAKKAGKAAMKAAKKATGGMFSFEGLMGTLAGFRGALLSMGMSEIQTAEATRKAVAVDVLEARD